MCLEGEEIDSLNNSGDFVDY
ncbi:hypothetical protein C5167_024310 [Papaver somniferum]|uniref:Uncharacterized protein n=1 Tax=Papaver somniferum TaxID=3469 RepID=A0A4Y7JS73_PAPSO|nr:hypothetical protein C5167_024310 [Papaver somniferum]